MENKMTPELLEKAKQAKSAEELIALAKENGTEITEESAKAYFAQLHKTGEIADDELDNVAGGRKCESPLMPGPAYPDYLEIDNKILDNSTVENKE